jgi:hypothetical protein
VQLFTFTHSRKKLPASLVSVFNILLYGAAHFGEHLHLAGNEVGVKRISRFLFYHALHSVNMMGINETNTLKGLLALARPHNNSVIGHLNGFCIAKLFSIWEIKKDVNKY